MSNPFDPFNTAVGLDLHSLYGELEQKLTSNGHQLEPYTMDDHEGSILFRLTTPQDLSYQVMVQNESSPGQEPTT